MQVEGKKSNIYCEKNDAKKTSETQNKEVKNFNKNKKDVFMQTPIRKLGFLDETGEALRPILSMSKNPIVSKLPNLAYIPANLYIATDVVDKYKKGDDGNGRNGAKMAFREAAYQSIVSIAAPMGIIRGTNKVLKNIVSANKPTRGMARYVGKAVSSLQNKQHAPKFLKKAKLPFAIISAGISLFVLNKLSKPVDFITKKVFNFTVDPMLGLYKKDRTENNKEM